MNTTKLLLIITTITSVTLATLLTYVFINNKPVVLFDKVIIPVEGRSYVCIKNSCVIYNKGWEFLLVLNESKNNCSKLLFIYPYIPFAYGVICENSTMYDIAHIVVNISK